jgi:DNA modification methylase
VSGWESKQAAGKAAFAARWGLTQSQSRSDPIAWLLGRSRRDQELPDWFDHGTRWLKDGQPYCLLGQPYAIDLHDLVALEDRTGLEVEVRAWPSWWHDEVLSVFVYSPYATSLRKDYAPIL